MRFRENMKPVIAEKDFPKFKGRTIFEEFDPKTKEVINHYEKDNAFTDYLYGLFGRGNYNGVIPFSELMPVYNKLLGGIICTDEENDVSEMCIADDAEITACANDQAYTGEGSSPRGSYSAENSGYFEDADGHGYQNCWVWTDRQGFENGGVIKSVGLTLPHIGAAPVSISDSSVPSSVASAIKAFNDANIQNKTLGTCQILDYDNDRAYKITYDGTVGDEAINVLVYELNTDLYHLQGSFLEVGRELPDEEFSVSGALSKSLLTLCWEQKTGHAYVINFTNNTGNIDIVDLDLAGKTGSKTAHTFSGVQITFPLGNNNSAFGSYLNFGMFISDGYFYCISHSYTKIMKCNLSSDVDVVDTDNPLKTIGGQNFIAATVELANGDFLMTAGTGAALWYHNGSWRMCYCYTSMLGSNTLTKMSRTKYGTIVSQYSSNYYTSGLKVLSLFPYLCTVNNLVDAEHPSGFVRTPGLGMKITYKIYEEEPV